MPPITFGKSRTQQNLKDECDINKIVERSRKLGQLPQSTKTPYYTDVSEIPDYQTAMHVVIQAQSQFDALDSKIRRRFRNDPSEMMAFLSDPANADEAVKLGMMTRREAKVEEPEEPAKEEKPEKKEKKAVQATD